MMKVIPVDVEADAQARFWFAAATVAFHGNNYGQWPLYERLKAMFVSRFPDATPAEYEAAMRRIERMAGV